MQKSGVSKRGLWLPGLLMAATILAGSIGYADEPANLTVKTIGNVNIRMYGFVETDLINDSTELSAQEELDNATVPKANTYAGQNHRTIMSVRNSRLGFDVTLPKTEDGLQTEGVFEMDFLGNQAANTTPGSVGGTQSERDFFNNPTVRVRHAYMNLTYNDWNAKIGQYWSLLGWQPYYFPSEAIVQPAIGQAYRRFPQIRLMNTQNLLSGDWTVESAIDAAKPANENTGLTDYHAGLRLASTKIKSVAGLSSGSSMVGLSLGASAAMIPVHTSSSTATGSAVAVDLHIPLIASSDGKSMSNNLSLTSEFVSGTGIGGLEIAGLTSGVGSPAGLASGAIDSGIAGIDAKTKDVTLLRFQTWRANLTYVFPNPKFAAAGGYAQAQCLNLNRFGTGTGLIPKYDYFYGNVFYMPLSWLKWSLEWAQIKNTYDDPINRFGYDNRIQFTSYIVF